MGDLAHCADVTLKRQMNATAYFGLPGFSGTPAPRRPCRHDEGVPQAGAVGRFVVDTERQDQC